MQSDHDRLTVYFIPIIGNGPQTFFGFAADPQYSRTANEPCISELASQNLQPSDRHADVWLNEPVLPHERNYLSCCNAFRNEKASKKKTLLPVPLSACTP